MLCQTGDTENSSNYFGFCYGDNEDNSLKDTVKRDNSLVKKILKIDLNEEEAHKDLVKPKKQNPNRSIELVDDNGAVKRNLSEIVMAEKHQIEKYDKFECSLSEIELDANMLKNQDNNTEDDSILAMVQSIEKVNTTK